eukprot:gene20971-27827_t
MHSMGHEFEDGATFECDVNKSVPASNRRESLAALRDLVAGKKDWWERKTATGKGTGKSVKLSAVALPNMAAGGQNKGLLFSIPSQGSDSKDADTDPDGKSSSHADGQALLAGEDDTSSQVADQMLGKELPPVMSADSHDLAGSTAPVSTEDEARKSKDRGHPSEQDAREESGVSLGSSASVVPHEACLADLLPIVTEEACIEASATAGAQEQQGEAKVCSATVDADTQPSLVRVAASAKDIDGGRAEQDASAASKVVSEVDGGNTDSQSATPSVMGLRGVQRWKAEVAEARNAGAGKEESDMSTKDTAAVSSPVDDSVRDDKSDPTEAATQPVCDDVESVTADLAAHAVPVADASPADTATGLLEPCVGDEGVVKEAAVALTSAVAPTYVPVDTPMLASNALVADIQGSVVNETDAQDVSMASEAFDKGASAVDGVSSSEVAPGEIVHHGAVGVGAVCGLPHKEADAVGAPALLSATTASADVSSAEAVQSPDTSDMVETSKLSTSVEAGTEPEASAAPADHSAPLEEIAVVKAVATTADTGEPMEETADPAPAVEPAPVLMEHQPTSELMQHQPAPDLMEHQEAVAEVAPAHEGTTELAAAAEVPCEAVKAEEGILIAENALPLSGDDSLLLIQGGHADLVVPETDNQPKQNSADEEMGEAVHMESVPAQVECVSQLGYNIPQGQTTGFQGGLAVAAQDGKVEEIPAVPTEEALVCRAVESNVQAMGGVAPDTDEPVEFEDMEVEDFLEIEKAIASEGTSNKQDQPVVAAPEPSVQESVQANVLVEATEPIQAYAIVQAAEPIQAAAVVQTTEPIQAAAVQATEPIQAYTVVQTTEPIQAAAIVLATERTLSVGPATEPVQVAVPEGFTFVNADADSPQAMEIEDVQQPICSQPTEEPKPAAADVALCPSADVATPVVAEGGCTAPEVAPQKTHAAEYVVLIESSPTDQVPAAAPAVGDGADAMDVDEPADTAAGPCQRVVEGQEPAPSAPPTGSHTTTGYHATSAYPLSPPIRGFRSAEAAAAAFALADGPAPDAATISDLQPTVELPEPPPSSTPKAAAYTTGTEDLAATVTTTDIAGLAATATTTDPEVAVATAPNPACTATSTDTDVAIGTAPTPASTATSTDTDVAIATAPTPASTAETPVQPPADSIAPASPGNGGVSPGQVQEVCRPFTSSPPLKGFASAAAAAAAFKHAGDDKTHQPEPIQANAIVEAAEPIRANAIVEATEPIRANAIVEAAEPIRANAIVDAAEPIWANAIVAAAEPIRANAIVEATEPIRANAIVDAAEPIWANAIVAAAEPIRANAIVEATEPIQANAIVDPIRANAIVEAAEPIRANAIVEATEPIQANAVVDAAEPILANAIVEAAEPIRANAIVEAAEPIQANAIFEAAEPI